MRLVLKLVLLGLSNADVCGGEVIGDDGKASILASGAGRRRQGRFFALTWDFFGLASSRLFMASQRRHLRSNLCCGYEIPSKYAPPFLPAPTTALISHLCPTVSHLKRLVDCSA
ncbi:hypothetical protein V2W45_335717 [Cenococcum geophilum]